MRLSDPKEINDIMDMLDPWMHFDKGRDRFWPREETPAELMAMWDRVQKWGEEKKRMKLEGPVW